MRMQSRIGFYIRCGLFGVLMQKRFIVLPPGGEVMLTSPHGLAGAVKVRELLPDGTLRRKLHEKKNKS